MADHDQRSGEVHQEIFQPGNRAVIQVVGRLVQQQNVRVAEQCLCQQHLELFAALQVAHEGIVHFRRQTQAGQQSSRIAFCVPAVQLGKFALQLGSLFAVCFGEVRLGIQGILFLHDIVKALVAHDDSVQHRISVIFELILLQGGKPLPFRDDHGTGGRFQFAGENPQEGGFSGTVCTDNAVAVAGQEFQISAGEKLLTAEGQGKVVNCNHGSSFSILDRILSYHNF